MIPAPDGTRPSLGEFAFLDGNEGSQLFDLCLREEDGISDDFCASRSGFDPRDIQSSRIVATPHGEITTFCAKVRPIRMSFSQTPDATHYTSAHIVVLTRRGYSSNAQENAQADFHGETSLVGIRITIMMRRGPDDDMGIEIIRPLVLNKNGYIRESNSQPDTRFTPELIQGVLQGM